MCIRDRPGDIHMAEEGLIDITLADGAEVRVKKGVTTLEVLSSAEKPLPENAVLAEINGETIELSRPLKSGGTLDILGFDSPRGRETYRHTASHVMAQAVKRIPVS